MTSAAETAVVTRVRRAALLTTVASAGLAVTLCATPASAGHDGDRAASKPPRTIAVLSLEVAGGRNAELRRVLARTISQGMSARGVQMIPHDEVALILARTPELVSCVSTVCLERIGELVGTEEFVRAHVAAAGASYDLDLELLRPSAEGGLAGRIQRRCSVCTVGELGELVAGATAELLASDASKVAIAIVCEPADAAVFIDGEEVGRAPYRARLPRGRHEIVARLDGRAAATRVVDLVPGRGEHRVDLILPAAEVLGGGRPYRTWKWVAAGTAVAAIAAGAALFAIDGGETCDGTEACPDVYDTRNAGLVGLAVGLVAGGASAWMFLRDTPGEDE